jgi:hypothetical protein
MGMELPGIAQQYDELKCVEPQPPGNLPELKDPEIPKKKKGPCPLGEKGISGDVVKDVALTSRLKAGLGGMAEGEVSARWAVEGGPSIESGGGLITPDLPINFN